jgi:hypothetical protein
MNGGMTLIVLGGIFRHWGLREFSAIFVVMGMAAGSRPADDMEIPSKVKLVGAISRRSPTACIADR